MRRNSIAVIVALTGLVLSSCGGAGAANDSAQTFRFSSPVGSTTPTNVCGLSQLPEAMDEAGSGLDIEVYTDGVLASEAEALEQVASGDTEGAVAGIAALSKWHEPIGVLEAAYAFNSRDEMNEMIESDLIQDLLDEYREETGFRVLGLWNLGERHLLTKEPVRTPEDLRGVKMRSVDNDLHMANNRSLGADPMPVPLGDTYIGLQQGLVEAVEGPLNTSDALSFNEVVNYVTLTGHMQGTVAVIVDETKWQELTNSDAELMRNLVEEYSARIDECVKEADEEVLQEWTEAGDVEVVDDADIDMFRSQVRQELPSQFVWEDLYYDFIKEE